MKRFAAPALLALLAGCASGGGTAPAPAGARHVLVEVRGSGPEAEAFAGRLLNEAAERGAALADARLAGGRLADLADAGSESSKRFREGFPGDLYLAADVGPCQVFSHGVSMPGRVDPMTGIRENDVVVSRDVTCAASVSVAGPDGKVTRSVSVEGRLPANANEGDAEVSVEAARAAATAAAKKLFGGRK